MMKYGQTSLLVILYIIFIITKDIYLYNIIDKDIEVSLKQ